MWVFLKEKMRQIADGKPPDAARVNEFGIIRAGGNEFNATAKFPLGFGWL
jgi:hypothetical protein